MLVKDYWTKTRKPKKACLANRYREQASADPARLVDSDFEQLRVWFTSRIQLIPLVHPLALANDLQISRNEVDSTDQV